MKRIILLSLLLLFGPLVVRAGETFEKDVIPTSAGDLEITFIGHGTLMIVFGGKVIHIDPYGKLADYEKLPEADIVLVTHQHGDHLDTDALGKVLAEKTIVVMTEKCREGIERGTVMRNGDTLTVAGIEVVAVPAYNIVNVRGSGQPFHPKGEGNGYILAIGGKRIYIAGDTENTPEMKALTGIDVAFLPMNLPYTMTPAMVADAVAAFRPKILYPYHYGETDPSRLLELLAGSEDTEVRIRRMK